MRDVARHQGADFGSKGWWFVAATRQPRAVLLFGRIQEQEREREIAIEREREEVSVWQQGAVDGGCNGGLRRLWRWRKSVVVACLLKAEIEREIRERGGGNERREIRVRFLLHLTLLSSVLWTRSQNDFGLTIGY